MTMIEEIYEEVLPMLNRIGVPDTPQHRVWALQGLVDGWLQDNPPPEAQPWINAALDEIFLQTIACYLAGVEV